MSFLLALALASGTTNTTPQAAIEAYGRAIAGSDAKELARAFQPSAIMYCTDGKVVRATYQAQWKTRLAAAGAPSGPVSTVIDWLDQSNGTALARATAVRGETVYVDYLLLAKLRDGWRIVGKLCQAGLSARESPAAEVDKVVDTKLAADRAWDPELLERSIDPRALVMTVDNGEFVAASVPEWQARYVDRRMSSSGSAIVVTGRISEARGDIGIARWSFHAPDGSDWVDRALMIRQSAGWRMVALLFVKAGTSGR